METGAEVGCVVGVISAGGSVVDSLVGVGLAGVAETAVGWAESVSLGVTDGSMIGATVGVELVGVDCTDVGCGVFVSLGAGDGTKVGMGVCVGEEVILTAVVSVA